MLLEKWKTWKTQNTMLKSIHTCCMQKLSWIIMTEQVMGMANTLAWKFISISLAKTIWPVSVLWTHLSLHFKKSTTFSSIIHINFNYLVHPHYFHILLKSHRTRKLLNKQIKFELRRLQMVFPWKTSYPCVTLPCAWLVRVWGVRWG